VRISVYLDGDLRRVLSIGSEPVSIGRGTDNQLILEDLQVSKHHCRLYWKGDQLRILDLKSVNGTRVEGAVIEDTALSAGSRAEVGPFVLVISAADSRSTEAVADRTQVTPRPVSELAILVSFLESLDLTLPRQDVLAKVLDTVLHSLDAERAFLFRPNARRTKAECILSRTRSTADLSLPVSESLVLTVARERQPRLFTDTLGVDARDDQSLARLAKAHVQSVVVAPMLHRGRLLGVLYVDSQGIRRTFRADELDLLSRTTQCLAGIVEGVESRADLRGENLALRSLVDRRPGRADVSLEQHCAPTSSFQQVLSLIRKVSGGDVTVFISGETGTGKEETARAIHRSSARSAGPFVPVNCAAIPETLVESVLFGHIKGAFSGADEDRPGLVELADQGTLFLDEVGELPPGAQAKLLRVLEEREVQRVGSGHFRSVDFRVVTATHRDLDAAVAAGRFRQDLLYRLKVFPIRLPPLRERKVDLPHLVDFLLTILAPRAGRSIKGVAPGVLTQLSAHDWPGNIRELRNVLECALVLEESELLTEDSLPPGICVQPTLDPIQVEDLTQPIAAMEEQSKNDVGTYSDELSEFERSYFRRLIRQTGSNISAMARISKVSRMTLYKKLGLVKLKLEDTERDADS
jgi:transcriptional regulator with GAF, ATPase, and Fis domain